MTGLISSHFIKNREQLQRTLGTTLRGATVDVGAFDLFRRGLLRHIAEEERVLFPALTRALGAPPLNREALRHHHAGLATWCAPQPERESIENLQALFIEHAALEEAPGGLYEVADQVLGAQAASVLAQARALPPIKLTPFNCGPWVRQLLTEVLRASGVAASPERTVFRAASE